MADTGRDAADAGRDAVDASRDDGHEGRAEGDGDRDAVDGGRDARIHQALADGTRRRILGLLRDAAEPADVRDVAARTGLHLSTVREHLERLVDAGLVTTEAERRVTRGRPRRLYRAVPDAPLTEDADGYRLLASVLAGRLAATAVDPAAAAIATGEAWGRELAASGGGAADVTDAAPLTDAEARARLLALLDDLGFSPAAEGDDVWLRRCPFLSVAREAPDVVCSLHLGLLRGALAAWQAPVTVAALVPFAEPTRCVTHLAAVEG